jgi:hypothetical protein
MASRREQKDKLRQERERREAVAKTGERRRQLIGYGVGGAVVLLVAIVGVVLLTGGGGSASESDDVFPGGGGVPAMQEYGTVAEAAEAAGCELESFKAKSRQHVASLDARVKYDSDPPTSGNHYQVPADEGAYEDPPDDKELVHTLEHGRVIFWIDPDLPGQQRANLRAYYDSDTYQTVLVPSEGMDAVVAATAWNRDPAPNGTGRLLTCPRYNEDVFAALETFKDEHRGRGPEPVP